MNFIAETNGKPCLLVINVFTKSPVRIRVFVEDQVVPVVFCNRVKQVNGHERMEVGLPVSGDNTLVCVYDEERGFYDDSFFDAEVKTEKLKQGLNRSVYDPVLKKFIDFVLWFSFYARLLPLGNYKHDGFSITYLNEIEDEGEVQNTPMRVSVYDGEIEASKSFCIKYTFPILVMLFLHEGAHFYLNSDVDNETEADLRALAIYRSMGFPKSEAKWAWLEVFSDAATEENARRYKIIEKYLG